MRVTDLARNQEIIVQINWGDRRIEFESNVLGRDERGIFISPYLHDDKALELEIDNSNQVSCNIYTDSDEGKRISWKNVLVSTVTHAGERTYYVMPRFFNVFAKPDERREHERIKVHKQGKAVDTLTRITTDIMVNDVSDVGISFYAPSNFSFSSNRVIILLNDMVSGSKFHLNVECAVARTEKKVGTQFYGCRVVGDNKDFLLYAFSKKMEKKKDKMDMDFDFDF